MNTQMLSQTQVAEPQARRRVHKHEKKLRQLRRSIFVVVAILLLVAMLRLLMPCFRVKKIEVLGNSVYSAEQIVAATGIGEGSELFSLLFEGIDYHRFYAACPYVRSVTLSYRPASVLITVTEASNVMYTQLSTGEWISFDDTLRVYEKRTDHSAFSSFLHVKMPQIASAEVGSIITFTEPGFTYDYVSELLGVLRSYQVLDEVNYIDFSSRISLACVFGGRIRLELGTVAEMNTKLDRFYGLLQDLGTFEYAVINVSNPQKCICNVNVGAEDLY